MEKGSSMNILDKIKVSFIKTTLSILSLLVLNVQVYAAPQAFSNELLGHIQSSAQKAANKKNEAKSRLEALGTGTTPNIKRHSYSGGVPYPIFYLNSMIDLFKDVIPNFLSCADPKFRGLCIKFKHGVMKDIKIKWEYHFQLK